MYAVITRKMREFFSNQSGATAIEYSLIAGLIFVAILGGLEALRTAQQQQFTAIEQAIDKAITP